MVDPGKVGAGGDKPGELSLVACTAKGIEQANLHIRMRGKRQKKPVVPVGVEVIQKQAHPYTTVGRVAQRAQQEPAGFVVFKVVVLHIQRHLGPSRQLQAGIQRESAQRHQPKAGQQGGWLRLQGDATQRGLV